MMGVYLIHFSRPLGHARHYLGWAEDIDRRYREHLAGRGSRIMAAAVAAGIDTRIVRTWEASRTFEAELKHRRDTLKLCPECREATLQRKAANKRRARKAA